jgi:hypothetical protein
LPWLAPYCPAQFSALSQPWLLLLTYTQAAQWSAAFSVCSRTASTSFNREQRLDCPRDGERHWLDITTIIIAVLFALFQIWRTEPSQRPEIVSVAAAGEVASGMAVFPLILVVGSSVSESATRALLSTNRVIMFIAGLFALAAVLEDRKTKTS